MRVYILFLLLNINFFSIFSQNNNKYFFSYYNLFSTSFYSSFKIHEKLKNIGIGKLNPYTIGTSFGINFKFNHMDLNLDLGLGGIQHKNTRILTMQSNLGIGYSFLKNGDFLTLGGSISYHLINFDIYNNMGSINFANNTVINPTSFSISTMQFMIGPMIRFEDDWYMISLGYDFGFIPMCWKSNNMMIINNYKERIDRIHIDYVLKIWNYKI